MAVICRFFRDFYYLLRGRDQMGDPVDLERDDRYVTSEDLERERERASRYKFK